MDVSGDKSFSDSEIPAGNTPPNFVAKRNKRKRVTEEIDLSDLREEMKLMIESVFKAQKQGFENNTTALTEIKQTNINIENALAFLTAQNEEMKNKIEKLEDKIKEDHKYIISLEDKIENLQQENRKPNFELKNVPSKPNETKLDLVDMVMCLSKTIGCDLNKSDIKDIYRVRGKKQDAKNMPIVVETSSTILKNDILKMCKEYNFKTKNKLCARHLGFRTFEDTPIYISNQLTAKGARLYFLARDLVKQKLYKYCWTAYGKVYIRKNDTSSIILIKSEAQIQDLVKDK
ncbi:unnamed protein product [Colias eurytheme]|nr:unnamed protein product [Colias eurytheme]